MPLPGYGPASTSAAPPRPDCNSAGMSGMPSSPGLSPTARSETRSVRQSPWAALGSQRRPFSQFPYLAHASRKHHRSTQSRRYTDKGCLFANTLGRGAALQRSSAGHAAATPRATQGRVLAPRPRVGWPDYAGSRTAGHSSPGPLGRTWGRTWARACGRRCHTLERLCDPNPVE